MTYQVGVSTKRFYDLEINGIIFRDCKFIDEWRGMGCFETKEGESIILDWDSRWNKDCGLVKASPSVLALIKGSHH